MSAVETLMDALYGNPPSVTHKPSREGVLAALSETIQSVNSLAGSVLASDSGAVFATRATLYAHLEYPDRTLGAVYADPNPDFVGLYVKNGGIGVGGWTFTGLLAVGPGPTDEQIELAFGTYVAQIEADVASAEASAASAALSASTAESAAGPTYPDTSDGLAATSDGQSFAVDNGDGTVTIYLNDGGSAVAQRTLATTAFLESSAGAGSVGFIQSGTGAVAETTEAALRRNGVYVQQFGAVGDGESNDTDAFNKATVAAQALGAPLVVPTGHYRVGGWIVVRSGGGIDIDCATNALIQLPDDAASDLSILDIKADGTKLIGGRFDGNVDVLGAGQNSCIRAFSEVSGEQIADVVISPDYLGNCSYNGIWFIGGARNCHARNAYVENTGLSGILFWAGNPETPGFDTDVTDCSAENCVVDRSTLSSIAEQGCIKFAETGTPATAKEVNNCRVVNCTAQMPETDGEHNGNTAIEIYAPGKGNSIAGCNTEGGYIGISVSAQNFGAIVSDCHAYRAQYIGIEAAAGSAHKVANCTVDCDDFTENGISLDYQGLVDLPGYGLSATCFTVIKPKVRGVDAIAAVPSTANVWKGSDVTIQGKVIFGSSTNATAVELSSIEGFDVDVFIDGAGTTGSVGVVMDRCTKGRARVVSRRMAGQIFQLTRNGAETTDNIHLELTNLDGSGTSFQMGGGSGAFGNNLTLDIKGAGYFDVINAKLAKLAASYGSCLLVGGQIAGTPEGNVEAAIGSTLTRTDGGAGTCFYVKETAPTASTGWVGK